MFRPAIASFIRENDELWTVEVTPQQFDADIDSFDRSPTQNTDELSQFLNNTTDTAHGTVNWAASGMIIVLQTADGWFIPVGWRDEDAPSHPKKLGTPSGLAETRTELIYPRITGYREALEEILIYNTKNDTWIRPTVSDKKLDHTKDYVEDSPHALYEMWHAKQPNTLSTTVTKTHADIHQFGSDTLTAINPTTNEANTITTHTILDIDTYNLDILDLLIVDLSETSIDSLTFYDGEEFDGTLLDRPIYLFDFDDFCTLFGNTETTAVRKYQSGRVWNGHEYTKPLTDSEPVTKKFDAVPVLQHSHEPLCDTLQSLKNNDSK